jgi:sec-independent protein translocase protein TatA
MSFGFTEIIIVLLVLLLVFGPGKIPQLGDAIGKGIKNFKKASKGSEDDAIDVTPKNPGQLGSQSANPTGTPADKAKDKV